MSILHVKSNTIADMTGTVTVFNSVGATATAAATDLIKPTDWNSAHNLVQNISGNTLGTSQVSGTDIIWAGGSNITLSGSAGVVTINGPLLTQYLTTAALSNHSHAFATTTTNGVSINVATSNSAGVTMAVPPYITTYVAQTVQTQTAGNLAGIGYTSTTNAGTSLGVTLNGAGLSVAQPLFLTTAAVSTHSHGNPTLALTNISGTTASASNGLTLSLSAAGAGAINQTGPNIAVAGVTITSGTVYFSNSPTVTFGMDGASNLTASAAGGGGGGVTVGGWELFPPLGGNTAFSTMGQNTIYMQKFIAPQNISFNNIERRFSGSSASSSIAATAAYTLNYGLYSRGAGASTSIYSRIDSSQMILSASYSSNLSAGYTISQGAGSFTSTSAGTVGQSALTGFKHIYMPFTSTLTAGVEYAVAMHMSSGTTGATAPLRIAFQELSVINNLTVGKLYASTILATNASFVGDFAQGVYSVTSSNLPATIGISGFTNAVSQQRMYIQFEV